MVPDTDLGIATYQASEYFSVTSMNALVRPVSSCAGQSSLDYSLRLQAVAAGNGMNHQRQSQHADLMSELTRVTPPFVLCLNSQLVVSVKGTGGTFGYLNKRFRDVTILREFYIEYGYLVMYDCLTTDYTTCTSNPDKTYFTPLGR